MTTLSKEDVVRIDNELLAMIQKHFPSLPLDDRYTDWGKWLRFAKAVYSYGEQAARADLVAENERLKTTADHWCEKAHESANQLVDFVHREHSRLATDRDELREELTATRTALAAAEADNKRLRDDFKCAANYVDFLGGDSKNYRQSIAQRRDDSTLRRLLAEAKAGVYEECAKACEDDAKGWTDYSCEMAARDCADTIRALAEKANGE